MTIQRLYNIAFAFALLSFTSSCKQNDADHHIKQSAAKIKLEGSFKLIALQEQQDTLFVPYEGVTIYKFFTPTQWNSPAINANTNMVINMSGGTYTINGDLLTEQVNYHMKDTTAIGLATTFKIEFIGDTLYQSGIYKAGTDSEWKVEEYWLKM